MHRRTTTNNVQEVEERDEGLRALMKPRLLRATLPPSGKKEIKSYGRKTGGYVP